MLPRNVGLKPTRVFEANEWRNKEKWERKRKKIILISRERLHKYLLNTKPRGCKRRKFTRSPTFLWLFTGNLFFSFCPQSSQDSFPTLTKYELNLIHFKFLHLTFNRWTSSCLKIIRSWFKSYNPQSWSGRHVCF